MYPIDTADYKKKHKTVHLRIKKYITHNVSWEENEQNILPPWPESVYANEHACCDHFSWVHYSWLAVLLAFSASDASDYKYGLHNNAGFATLCSALQVSLYAVNEAWTWNGDQQDAWLRKKYLEQAAWISIHIYDQLEIKAKSLLPMTRISDASGMSRFARKKVLESRLPDPMRRLICKKNQWMQRILRWRVPTSSASEQTISYIWLVVSKLNPYWILVRFTRREKVATPEGDVSG